MPTVPGPPTPSSPPSSRPAFPKPPSAANASASTATTTKPHKFKLVQQWTVKAPPERAAEILDVAITAGATSSGDIEWTVKDERALEAQALDRAAARAKENAAVLAKAMGVHLGSLIYVSNQLSVIRPIRPMAAFKTEAAAPQPLAIEPHKVSRSASVYAVYSIE